ncbi:hypothetical protein [Paenibacillus senegalensis]|uniref:hypothetical protein n=1 Tax=Paenibacillus senegalensis TaxID=1465766 RepID=UPI0011DDC373|nr:hypothetical protein [Paenibacillus senegalensis]
MNKMKRILVCVLISTLLFGQWQGIGALQASDEVQTSDEVQAAVEAAENSIRAELAAADDLYVLNAEESESDEELPEPENLLSDRIDIGFESGISPFVLDKSDTGGSQQLIQIGGNTALEFRDASNGANQGSLFYARLNDGKLVNRIKQIYNRPVGSTPVAFEFSFKLTRTSASDKPVGRDIKAAIQFGNFDNNLIPRFPTAEPSLFSTAAYQNEDPDWLIPVTSDDIATFRFEVVPNGGQRNITSVDLRFSVRTDTGGTDEAYAIDDLMVYEVPSDSFDNMLLVDELAFTEPGNLFVLGEEMPALQTSITNSYPSEVTGNINISVWARETELVQQLEVPIELALRQAKTLVIPLDNLDQADYYHAQVQVIEPNGDISTERKLAFGIVHPAVQGVRSDSPFGMDLRPGNEQLLQSIAQKMGVKWRRGIDAVDPPIVNPRPGVFWGEEEIEAARQEVLDWEEYGVRSLGYINYNMPWNVMPIPGVPNPSRHQNRPLDLVAHAEMVYQSIAPLHDLVEYWEVWNEPWIRGWTWKTGDAQDYRDMTRLIWERVKPEFPDVMLIGGGSTMYNRDILYAQGSDDIGYVDGSVNHAYGLPDPEKYAMIRLQKILDEQGSRSGGKAGMWQTELGTAERFHMAHLPEAERKYGVARTIAPIYLLNMLAAGDMPVRIFWFSLSPDASYSGDDFNLYDSSSGEPKPGVIAYSAMTHFLEDSKLLEELYPSAKSSWGFLFERQNGGAVAALYADEPYSGTLRLADAEGIEIYDYLGRRLSAGSEPEVSLALRPWETVYIVADHMSPAELKQKLLAAEFDYTNPLMIHPLSLLQPVDAADNKLEIDVENVTPERVSGVLTVEAPPGWILESDTAVIADLAPGEKRRISLPALETEENEFNRYPVKYSFDRHDAGGQVITTQAGQQTIQVAHAPRKTIRQDHTDADWQDVLPVTMLSNGVANYLDLILDPSLIEDIIANPDEHDAVIYNVKTAWDDDYFYFRALVPDQSQMSNPPFAEDPYAFAFNADSVQLAFDVVTDNPDDLLRGDPHYDKAAAAHMDYLFVGTMNLNGEPELHRQAAPGTNKQTYYPTNAPLPVPLGPMDVSLDGGSEGWMKVARDESNKQTVYDIAVAWQAVPELSASLAALQEGETLESHFSFAIHDAGTDALGTSFWTREVGQVVSGSYAYAPFWGTGAKERGGALVPRWGFGREPGMEAESGKPGKPVLSHTQGHVNGLRDGNYEINMNMWWGNNGSSIAFYENDVLVHEQVLIDHSPHAQSVSMAVYDRPNGEYRYYVELKNEYGITRSDDLLVTVTQAAPGKPVLSRDYGNEDGNYRLRMNMWWGTNGDIYRLYENGRLLDEQVLKKATPYAQTAVTDLIGKSSGTYTYKAELENSAGITESDLMTVVFR